MAACGRKTTVERNEFMLLSDVLGVTSLVDLINQQPESTEGSVLGPFYQNDSITLPSGSDLRRDTPGIPVLVRGAVSDSAGRLLPGAVLDVWSNAENGLYPAQDPRQHPHNLRAKITADDAGCYAFVSTPPQPYQVPYDGPVGDLLRAGARHAWRPAHFHFVVSAQGCSPLATEVFIEGDPYLDADAVFGVRASLVRPMERCADPALGKRFGIEPPFCTLDSNFMLRRMPGASAVCVR